MSNELKLLSPARNYAIVQLPGRNHPGVVVQGDTLNAMVKSLSSSMHLLQTGQLSELSDELDNMLSELQEALKNFEMVCGQQGLDLPYPKNV
jgi:hypothetical protein